MHTYSERKDMMTKQRTIGIYTPYLVGHYYGVIIHSVYKYAKARGIRVIAVRTEDTLEKLRGFWGFNHMDGIIIMDNTRVSNAFLNQLDKTNKPVIGIGSDLTKTRFPTVSSDNFEGAYKAVLHLIDHGHQDIAFVGYLDDQGISDIKDRLDGYTAALAERSIPYDPEFVFRLSDSHIRGGEEAAKLILQAGIPCTAIMTGTDVHAIHMISKLKEAGLRFPDDLAVIGFDDIELAESHTPSLSTVRQSMDNLGKSAVKGLIKLIEGEKLSSDQLLVESKLILRESCGCSIHSSKTYSIFDKTERDRVVIDYLEEVATSTQRLGKNLIKANREELRNLYWTHSVPTMNWGCLGLWESDNSNELRVEPYYSMKGLPSPTFCSIENFPPIEYVSEEVLSGSDDEIMTITLIQSETKTWGAIVLFERITDFALKYDSSAYCFAFIASAVESESLQMEVKSSENRLRMTLEQLESVLRTTTDGIWNWDLKTNEIEFSERFKNIFGDSILKVQDPASELSKLIHPDDLQNVMKLMNDHFKNSTPFQIEFRLKMKNDEFLWVYATAEVIRDAEGDPIRMIGSIRDVSERKSSEEKITYMAYHDVLTGLPNRMYFYDRLTFSIKNANKNGHKLAVLLFDLDRFKLINDSYGHPIGDRLLKFVAQQLMDNTPAANTVARLGGDEFIILIPRIIDEEEALSYGNMILEILKVPFVDDSLEFFITGSLGISIYPNDGEDRDLLIKHADIAMYRAKSVGRNNVKLYDPGLNKMTIQRVSLENSLRKALGNSEFILYFQPQVCAVTGNVYGMEALIRWNSPERGVVNAFEFITLAEEMGLIIPLSNWVLHEACMQNKKWQQAGYAPLEISVNISAHQFNQADFASQVKTILLETNLEPKWLCLEITESTAMYNLDLSKKTIEELIELGVSFSIDDFGTGYSSLALLKRLPIQFVKIDKSFIRDMTEDTEDAAIVNAIIAMSHSLKLRVVAEGVETQEQMVQLQEMSCDSLQGYYISYPLPLRDFQEQILKK